jgi:hypothetical protein
MLTLDSSDMTLTRNLGDDWMTAFVLDLSS